MRIAAVCPYSVSVPGGVQDQVLGLARELRALGHEVDVVAPCDGEAPPGVIAVGRSLGFRVNGSTAAMAPTPSAAARTVRVLQAGRYDVLHVHEPVAPSITIPAVLRRVAPVIGTFHAGGEHTPYRWFGAPLRRIARRIDVRVAVSAEAARLASRHLGGEYEVLFNGIDQSAFGTAAGGRGSDRTVLFLGRHEQRKGLEVLLRATAGLPDDVTVWVAGDGPERSRLQHRFGDGGRIRWLGRLSDDEKRRRLAAASVVCAPSLHGESFGVVLLEAMAAGTPVVASDLPGYREVADGGRAALLTPPGDDSRLAAALRRVLDDAELAEALRAHGSEVACRFTLGSLARRYADLSAHLVDRSVHSEVSANGHRLD